MDIQMPIMDGVVATRILRELQAQQGVNPRCLVVGLSAHAMSGDRERYLQEGMDEYLTKPIAIAELERVLRGLLRPVNDMILWR
jgi:CheY-like chemotaxis protein